MREQIRDGLIRLIAFDLGGVIVNIHHTFTDCVCSLGLPVFPKPIEKSKEGRLRLLAQYQSGDMSLLTYCQRLHIILERVYSVGQLSRIHRAQIIGLHDMKKTASLFTRLQKKGYEIAILSNTCDIHWQKIIEYMPILNVDYYFLSFEMCTTKPLPQYYHQVERETGNVTTDILFFDDSHENVIAAGDRGWHAHQIVQGSPPLEQIETMLKRYEIYI